MNIRLNIIVAACENQGIGINGELPWKLRKEMKYFSQMTKSTKNPLKKNAVVMGRKTWESIPDKFRPLPGRLNIVISSQANSAEPNKFTGCIPCLNFDDAIKEAGNESHSLETVWVIGGSSIYKMALESNYLHRVYLTKILKDFKCDTFLPSLESATLQSVIDTDVPQEIQTEESIQYKYEVYEKK